MPTYKITDPQTGKTLRVTGDSPPTEDELTTLFASQRQPSSKDAVIAKAKGEPAQPFASLGIQTVSDEDWATLTPAEKAKGLLTAAGKGLATTFGMGREGQQAVDHPKTTLAIAAAPTVAKGVAKAAPVVADAVGRATGTSFRRAGEKFTEVMGAAKDVPIDISKPGAVALRIQELAERGGSMPKAVRDILKRMTDPNKGALTYGEARDFASNISRLSADESRRLTPVVRRELGNLRVALNQSVEAAAGQAGKAEPYRAAMREYARASRVNEFARDTGEQLQRYAIPGGIAVYGMGRLSDLIRGER